MAETIALPKWWPTCGRCRGPVTRFEYSVDPATPGTGAYRFECHGEVRILPVRAVAAGNVGALDPWKGEAA